jgi:hypothetical protein
MKEDKFLTLRLNLEVLRGQIITKLQARKFELSNLDRAYRTRTLGTSVWSSCKLFTPVEANIEIVDPDPRPCRTGHQLAANQHYGNGQEL